jgi:cysteine desulfurase
MKLPVYLDHAATTPVRPEVLEAMMPYLTDKTFGNPSSAHRFGRAARAGIEQARRQIAEALGAEPSQVIFTSGGTEADNLGIVGAALAARDRGAAMCAAVSATEHKAVLAAAHAVCHLGGREVLLPVDGGGILDLRALDEALAGAPAIVSVMWVNNEVGTVQPVGDIAARCHEAGVIFHTDAVQAIGKVPVSVKELRCTLLTISGHKIGAPKGIGALIVRDRKAIEAIIHGGGQQFGIRPGTENVAGAVALGRAVQLAAEEQPSVAERVASLRDLLARRLKAIVSDLVVNAEQSTRAPHLLSVAIPGADSEALLMHFDLAGVAVSSGSACSTGAVEPSHVLVAMGIPRELALGTIRFSLGRETTEADIERAVEVVPGVVEKVRKLAGVLGRMGGTTERRNDGTTESSDAVAARESRGGEEPTAVPPYRRTAEGTR